MNDHLDDVILQKHADGESTVEERWAVEAHLGGCPLCARRYETLVALVERVGALDSSVEPPADLWPAIAERIREGRGRFGTGGRLDIVGRSGTRTSRRAPMRGPLALIGWITAAAAVLALGVGLGRMMPRSDSPVASEPVVGAETPTALAVYDETGAMYDEAIEDLLQILVERREELRPETVAAIEENLRIIDAAIVEARAALEADPANESLHRHLSTYMQTKLAVLRMVTGAVAAEI